MQPHEHVVRQGWSCRLLVREPNLKLPNVPGVNVEVGELAKGLKLPNVWETNVELLILPTVRFPNGEEMKEKCLLVTRVPESSHYRQGPAEKGVALRQAWQQVLGTLEVLLVKWGQLWHVARMSRPLTPLPLQLLGHRLPRWCVPVLAWLVTAGWQGAGGGLLGHGADQKGRMAWVVGHSYIYWVHRRTAVRHCGLQLGFPSSVVQLRWFGYRGWGWNAICVEMFHKILLGQVPDIVVLHAGGNDVGLLPQKRVKQNVMALPISSKTALIPPARREPLDVMISLATGAYNLIIQSRFLH
ncbi:uncharacterized protein LOC134583157 [Pelobates fuscus]|uniref:uncharacterized protein LOC134583157 n=1 Tax=Pelobates fuscus TaxID=191477 RepID=UPI002FE45E62